MHLRQSAATAKGYVTAFGVRITNPTEFKAGETAELPAGAAR